MSGGEKGRAPPRAERYKSEIEPKTIVQKKEFSWDKKKKDFKLEDFQFKNEQGKFLFKDPNTLKQ